MKVYETTSEKLGKVMDLLVKQIKHEFTNERLYRYFSDFFKNEGLLHLSKYYNERACEEKKHAQWIINYLHDLDIIEDYSLVSEKLDPIKNYIDTFTATIDREVLTTNMIKNIIKVAREDNDEMTLSFIFGCHGDRLGKLLPEQLEEEKLSRTVYNIAKQDSDWIAKEEAILHYYENR